MRPPSPLRSRPGSRLPRHQVCHPWLWARAHVRASALGQSPLGALLLAWRLEHGLDVSVTAAVGAGRSVAGGGAALERRSLERRRHAAGSPHQRDSSPTPHTHYAKMSSASAGGPQPTPPLNNGRREKPHLPRPRSVPPAPPHPHFKDCPRLLGNEECPHYNCERSSSARRSFSRRPNFRLRHFLRTIRRECWISASMLRICSRASSSL